MTLLIQNTQNRHAKSMQLKLNELIRAVEGARTHLVSLENLNEKELELLQQEFEKLSAGIKASQGILEQNEQI
jgi:low affinity Fe/Cu permease